MFFRKSQLPRFRDLWIRWNGQEMPGQSALMVDLPGIAHRFLSTLFSSFKQLAIEMYFR